MQVSAGSSNKASNKSCLGIDLNQEVRQSLILVQTPVVSRCNAPGLSFIVPREDAKATSVWNLERSETDREFMSAFSDCCAVERSRVAACANYGLGT